MASPTLHVVAYDVRATSPLQPRVVALLRELERRSISTHLWTEVADGLSAFVHVHRVADIGRVIRSKKTTPPAATGTPGPEPRRMRSTIRALGRRILDTALIPDDEAPWSAAVAARLGPRLRRGDGVITFSRPESVGLIGEIARLRGAGWWSDYGDGWTVEGLRPNVMRPGARRQIERRIERRWLRRASGVSTVNEHLATIFGRLGGRDDVAVFPNIIPEELDDSMAAGSPGDTLTIGYFGRLAGSDVAYATATLVAMLADAPRAKCSFVFRGAYANVDHTHFAALSDVGYDTDVSGPVPRGELATLRAGIDSALMVGAPGKTGSSAKLLDYLGMRLPVFALVEPESLAADIIAEANLGRAVSLHLPAAEAAAAWRAFLEEVRQGSFVVNEAVRSRYLSATQTPPFVDRVLDTLFG